MARQKPTEPPASPAPAALGDRVASAARKYTGARIPYRYGGKDPRAALDCSGFVWHVLRDAGLDVPYRASGALAAWAVPVSRSDARPGDLVFWPHHVAVYLGDGQIIDQGGPGPGPHVRSLWGSPKFGRIPK